MIKRLRLKFVCINMVIVTVMLAVIFSLVIFFVGKNMEQENRAMLQILSEPMPHPGVGAPERPRIWQPHFVVRVDPQGKFSVDQSDYFEEMDQNTMLTLARKALSQKREFGLLEDDQLRFLKKNGPGGQTVVFADISSEMRTMQTLIITCVVISIVSFCAFLVISFQLAKWAVKPVETAWNQQRQFVADASHELKTPLTVIMTNAELLQAREYDDTERSRFADSILVMSRQMRGLVEGLLELARVDNGTAKMVFSELDLSALVSEGVLPFEPVYFEKGLLLESETEEGLRVRGSHSHLRQVLDILLDNAAKYSTSGGTVYVRAKRQGCHCILSVASPGEAISREDLQNIFKRFYRIDKARAMNHSYGLGLSIADSIVREHGGKIWAESAEGINTFYVQLNRI